MEKGFLPALKDANTTEDERTATPLKYHKDQLRGTKNRIHFSANPVSYKILLNYFKGMA
jgi:hypothetical protein